MSIDYLLTKCYERDSHVIFDEGPHIYTVDGDDSFMSVATKSFSFEHLMLIKLSQYDELQKLEKNKYYVKLEMK